MFRKLIIALAVLIAMPAVAFAQKFGVVDTETILTSMPDFQTMRTSMEALSKKHEEELQSLRTKFDKELADFQALPADTPESIKNRRAEELQEMNQKIEQYYAVAQQDIQKQQQTMMEPIQKRIVDAITTVGNEGGFTFIFQKDVPLFSGSTAVDVTDQVKAKLGL